MYGAHREAEDTADYTQDIQFPDYTQDQPAEPADDRPVCRDFMRNVCQKGARCKYRHVQKDTTDVFSKNPPCHDFQNKKGCERPNCKYLHITKEEEDYLKTHGVPPPSLPASERAKLDGLPPVCSDYLAGKCDRGSKCKFRHVGGESAVRGSTRGAPPSYRYDPYPVPDEDYRRMEMRRRYREDMMEDEIMYLRAQVGRLKRQVADLTATNESLMDENARLRVHRPLSPRLTATANPTAIGAAFSNSPRLVAADPYPVAAKRPALTERYSAATSTPSVLSFSAAAHTLNHYA